MESQQLLDTLTAHIALYHSSPNPNPNPNSGPRSAILRWFSALSGPQRQSALTVVDPDFVSVLLLMLRRLRSAGAHGHFFLLPDLPEASAPGLPSLCFRQSRGLLRRAAASDLHSPALTRSLRLFSSKDGDLFPPCSDCPLDSITVAEDFVSTVDGFVETMDGISGWRFLRDEESGLGKPWAELPWLRDKGYYSMEAFVANKLEIALRLSWLNSAGGKKQKGGKGKEKERAAGFASAAANAFWRKKGCFDWWRGLDPGHRKDFMVAFLGKVAKFLAKQIAKEPKITLNNETCSFLTEVEWPQWHGPTSTQSLFEREKDLCLNIVSVPRTPHAVSNALIKLVALQEISTMFSALQHKEFEKDILFFSKLGSAHTISDFIFRKLRGFIMVVSMDTIKLELMGDEKLKALPNKTEEKFASGHQRGKNKCRKSKSSKPTPKPSKIDIKLHEPSGDHGSGSAFIGYKGSRTCPKPDTHSVVADEKKRMGSTCSMMNDDVVKECDKIVIDCKGHTNKKKGGKKGATSKTSSSKEPTKVGNPGFENHKTINSSCGVENELAKSVGSVGSSTIHPVSYDSVLRDGPPLTSSASNYPVAVDIKNAQVENTLHSTADSSSGPQNCCLNTDKGEDGQAFDHASSSLTVDEGSRQTTSLSHMPTVNCCDELIEHCVGTPVPCSSVTSCCGCAAPTRELEHDVSVKEVEHHVSPCMIGSSSEPVAHLNLLQAAIDDQNTVIQAGSSKCYAYNGATSNGGPPYEWPNMAPLNFPYVNSQHLPPATDRLHLDVGHKWPTHLHQSYLSSRHQTRSSSIDGGCSRILHSLTLPMSYDWPPMVKSCSRLGQSVTVGYDSGYAPRLWSSFCSDFSSQGLQNNENDMKRSRDYMDVYDSKIASELADETESYWLSEEESDGHAFSGQDYNQVFGGGVMYWNTSDYVGTGFSRPPSYSSEDSLWAWREADLNRAIDDMVGMPGLPASYNANGLSSPPAAPFRAPLDSLGPGHQSVAYAMPANDVSGQALHSPAPITDAADEKNSRSLNTASCGVEGMKADTLPYQRLRPIIVPGISRKGSRSDFKPSHDRKSPCLQSTIRDHPRIKRPPSPVVLCVPRVPRPPPPSPVGESRRRGFPIVRSGSSSPRHWGMRNWYHEEGHSEETCLSLDGAEVVWPSWGNKGLTSTPMVQSIQDSMLQNHLMTISQLSRDQEHPDVAFPVQRADLLNSPSHKISLSMLHSLLNEEIECFCKQVAAENLVRKPYINWAVKRVTRALQVLWPRSRTNIYGSNATCLALPSSDVDLVVSLPPVRNLEPIKEAGILEGRNGIKETCLQHAARYLANQEWVRNDSLKTIENTAIPVIMLAAEVPNDIISSNGTSSVVDTAESQSIKMPGEQSIISHPDLSSSDNDSLPSCPKMRQDNANYVKSIRIDISFESPSHTGLQTSELVRELTQQFPASVPLALVLKQFLADRSLDHSYSGGLSSYCLILLITRFLQHEHHVCRLINQNLGGLLMDFLYFFGNVFDPRQMRISIQGTGVYMKRERGLSIDPFHIDDPLHPTNNVGRNCFRIHQCIKAFADAYSVLENELSQLSDNCGTSSRPSSSILPKIIPSINHEKS